MRNFCYAAFGAFLLLLGCNVSDMDFDNLKLEEIKADVVVPFGTAKYTMRELIEDVSDPDLMLEEDPVTGELRLTYTQYAEYLFTPDIISIPDNSTPSTLTLNNTVGPAAYSQTIPFTQSYMSTENEILDSVFHAPTSSIQVTVSSTSAINLNYTLTIQGTTNVGTGVPVTFTGVVNSGTPQNHSQSLANHKTEFQTVGMVNQFDLQMQVSGNLLGGQDLNNDQITVLVEYLSQDFTIVFGKLGQDTVDISGGDIAIDFFDDFTDEGLEFGGAVLSVNARNSFGIPFGLGLRQLYGEQQDGTRTFLGGAAVTNPLVIQSASTEHPVTGTPVATTLNINTQNSTLRQLLATSPTTLGLNFQAYTNPYNTNTLNFCTDTASIRADIELVLPMEVRMTNVQRVLDFDIPGGFSLDEADSASLRVLTTNGFPFRANMDIYFMSGTDTLYQALDNEALGQPFLNRDRSVQEPKITVDDVGVSRAGLDALEVADQIMVVITMNTPESLTSEDIFVKLLATAELEVTLGIRAIIRTEL